MGALTDDEIDAILKAGKKECPKCQQVKPLSDFRKNERLRLGFDSKCKLCQAENLQAWRKANPDKVKAQTKRKRDAESPEQKMKKAEYQKEWWKNNADKKPEYDKTYRIKNAHSLRERRRQHRIDNPELYRDREGKKWANRDPERYKQRKRERYQANPDRVNEYNSAWAKANPEKRREYNRKWYEANKAKAHEGWLLRRARKKQRPSLEILDTEIRKIYESPCLACGSTDKPQMEHVIPVANEFCRHGIGNLTTLCKRCNSSKGDQLWVEWKYSLSPRAREVFPTETERAEEHGRTREAIRRRQAQRQLSEDDAA